jgi:hypothetical protein
VTVLLVLVLLIVDRVDVLMCRCVDVLVTCADDCGVVFVVLILLIVLIVLIAG